MAVLFWQHLVIGLAHITCCVSVPSSMRVFFSSLRQESTHSLALHSLCHG